MITKYIKISEKIYRMNKDIQFYNQISFNTKETNRRSSSELANE